MKKSFILIVLLLISECFILIWFMPGDTIFVTFGSILFSSIVVLKWYQISLKRFFLLIFLPAIILSTVFIFMKLIPEILSLDFILNMDFLNGLAGLIFKLVGNSLFFSLFAMYLMFPALVLFATFMLMSEKVFSLHSQLTSLIAPFIACSLVYLQLSFIHHNFKPSGNDIGMLTVTGIAALLAVVTEQYLQKRHNAHH